MIFNLLQSPTVMQENLLVEEMGLRQYKPHFQFKIDTARYQLKIAENIDQLLELFAFRKKVFSESGALQNNSLFSDPFKIMDFDAFDSQCDHITVMDKETGSICGTYRIALSSKVNFHYSQIEFNLDQFLALPGLKMELGRAAISNEHRNGSVLDLLWFGLSKYAQHSQAQFLFGCSSVMTMDKRETKKIFDDLTQKQYLLFEHNIQPTKKYYFSFDDDAAFTDSVSVEIPPLLLSYLRAGSKVYGKPALDQDFGCIDFMTILNLKNLTNFYKKRYFREVL